MKTRSSKRRYLDLCMQMPVEWLRRSAENPSVCMTRMDVAIHYLAIRKKRSQVY